MTERATVAQVTQIGAESTAGTAVAASKLLASLELTGGIKVSNQVFRPAGRKYPAFVVPGREWSEWKLGGWVTYGEVVYPLSSILKTVTPSNDTTLGRLWTYTPALSAEDTVKTFTVEQGGLVRAHRFAYGIVSELGFRFTREGCQYDGTMLGMAIEDDIHLSTNATYTLTTGGSALTNGTFTLTKGAATTAAIAHTATPAAVQAALEAISTIGTGNVVVSLTSGGPNIDTAATVYTIEFVNALAQQPITLTGTFTGLTPSGGITLAAGVVGVVPAAIEATPVPIAGSQICVYVADSWAGLAGATRSARVLSAEWRISNRFAPLWVLDCSEDSFVAHVETVPEVTCKVMVEADDEGMAFLTLMRNATTKWLRIKATGPNIETGKDYLFQIDGAYNVSEPSEFSDQDGVYALEWTLVPVYDSVATKTIEVQVRNKVAAL